MNRKIVLLVSLLAGFLAAVLTRTYMTAKEAELKRARAKLEKQYETRDAICFSRDVTSGQMITEKDLEPGKTYSRNNADVLWPNQKNEIIGKRVTGAQKFAKGTPVRRTFVEGGVNLANGLNERIPKNHRAISINVTGSTSVSGLINRGDEVDVIATFDFPSDDGKIRRGDPVTCTILQKVQVLATGNDSSGPAKSLGVYGPSASSGYSLVTLAVTPREAEMLAFAEQQLKGRLTLTLRRFDDLSTETELPNVNFTTIRAEVEDLNKVRNNPNQPSRLR